MNRRRLRGDLIAAYNVFSGGLDSDPSLFYFASTARLGRSSFPSSTRSYSVPSKKVVLFNVTRKIFEQAPHFYWNRPFRQLIQTPTRFDVGGYVCRSPVISHSFIPPLNYTTPVYAFPTPNSLSYIIVLTSKFCCISITLPICDYRGPLWSHLPLNIIIIIIVKFLKVKLET